VRSMNCTWPRISAFDREGLPLRIMFIASYPAIVFSAPATDRNHWTGHDPLLHEAMILLEDVVQVRRSSTPRVRFSTEASLRETFLYGPQTGTSRPCTGNASALGADRTHNAY
jgi:hypothetical protein